MPELTAIVPFYNEARTLNEVVEAISQLPSGILSQVIFVNDGSEDHSESVLKEALTKTKFLNTYISKTNGGKASAVLEGLKHVKTSHVVILDADLELDISELPRIWDPILSGKSDAVFGFRDFKSHTSYTYRYAVGNRFISHLYGILFNQVITDVMCGYKIFPTRLKDSFSNKASGFAIEVAIPVALWKNAIRPREMPVSYHARSRHEGKIINIWDALYVIATLFFMRMTNGKPRNL